MVRLKVGDDELNVRELDEAEYNESDFEPYDGPIPPKNTILIAYVKSQWWTFDRNDKRMIKTLVIVDGNEGEKAKYNGMPIFDNTSIIPGAKFRWAPMMRVLGFTTKDLKTKLYVAEEDHPTLGAPVEKIGTFVPGEDSDVAWIRVVTGRHTNDGELLPDIAKWLEYEEPQEPEEPEDEADEPDEDEPDEDEPEDEPETPPARGGRRTAAAQTTADKAKPAAAGARPATRSTATRAGKPAAGRAAPKAATTGRGRPARGSKDDPPF